MLTYRRVFDYQVALEVSESWDRLLPLAQVLRQMLRRPSQGRHL